MMVLQRLPIPPEISNLKERGYEKEIEAGSDLFFEGLDI
jgi:hypothetical protein